MAKTTKVPPVEAATTGEKGAAPKKAAAKKAAPRKTASKKAAPKKTAPKKTAAKPGAVKTAAPRTISAADRQARIAEAAYLRAESLGFAGDPHDHWVYAETEVDARLRKSRVNVTD